jgi:hypothetical protein
MSQRYSGRNIRAFAAIETRSWLRASPAETNTVPDALQAIYAEEKLPALLLAPPHVKSKLEFEKWRIIHKLVHKTPVTPDPALPRAEQWRAMFAYFENLAGEPATLDWIAQQAEIADHIAAGIQDLRPRKAGPCHPLLLEYIGNRKRKALAVYKFAVAAKNADPTLDWQVTEDMIARWRRGQPV